MNAQEARSIANKIQFSKITEEWTKIQKEVTDAVKKGKFSVTIFGSLTHENKIILENEGFRIRSYTSGHNETETEISW